MRIQENPDSTGTSSNVNITQTVSKAKLFCLKYHMLLSKVQTRSTCFLYMCLRQPAEMRRLLHFLQRSACKPEQDACVRHGKSFLKAGHIIKKKHVWLRNDDNDFLCVTGLREQRSNFCCSGVTVAVRPGGSPHVKRETC